MTPKELFKKVKEEEDRVLTRAKSRATSNSDFLEKLAKGLEDIRAEMSFYWGRNWLFRKRYAPFELSQGENCITVSFGRGRKLFCTFIADECFDISCNNKVAMDAEDYFDDDIYDYMGASNTIETRGPNSVTTALELIMKVLVKFEEGGASEDLKD